MKPTEVLKAEHRVIEQVLNCLEVMTDRACVDGRLDGATARDVIDFFRNFADGCHHAKEEEHFFPMLEQYGFDPDQGPTAVMRTEHHIGRLHLRGMEANLVAAAAGDPDALTRFADQAWAFIKLLREHIQKEDQRLFAMADRFLNPQVQGLLLLRFEEAERGQEPGKHQHYLALADSLAERFGVPRAATTTAHTCSHARR